MRTKEKKTSFGSVAKEIITKIHGRTERDRKHKSTTYYSAMNNNNINKNIIITRKPTHMNQSAWEGK